MKNRETAAIGGILVLAVALLVLVAWVLPSYFEARAFEHVTGQPVSTWDAMWIELRVMEGSK